MRAWSIEHVPKGFAATWCNGAAGMTLLWTSAFASTKDQVFLEAAREMAQLALRVDERRSILCCGLTGVAYALLELDRHDRTFPNGPLRTEATVLRAEALLAHGETARAKRLAQDLLARDPNGPSARRLRTITEAP